MQTLWDDRDQDGATEAHIEALLESIQWYMKVPYLSAGVEAAHIRALFGALPGLVAKFCASVRADAADAELARRLPKPLINAFMALG